MSRACYVREEFYKMVEDAINNDKPLYCIGFYFPDISDIKVDLKFTKPVYFSYARFQQANFKATEFQQQADFSYAEFGEVDFININFPNNYKGENNKPHINKDIPIKFNYSTFRGRARFIGKNDNEPLDLSNVSLKGVALDNVEFHNVKWREDRVLRFIKRNVVVDELIMDVMNNYQEVSRIYNRLRKNYEMQLLFNEALHFFIGEMEAIRRSLSKKGMSGILESIPYLLYKYIALYGENVFLPLVVWTPVMIIGFAILRTLDGMCYDYNCVIEHVIDSIAAYFQVPRDPQRALDIIERILAVPILGSAFIAIKRRFEGRK